MPNPLRDLFFPGQTSRRALLETITPRRTFADVVLPETTLRQLQNALTQIEKHDVLFNRWGLAERHTSGLGLAFNFAGPPGTGKTICAEAVAHVLGRTLLVVRYAEIESMWAGNTGKNVSAVFRAAEEEDAVLFFDEADAIAGRRFVSMDQGYQREANAVVNVLLRELESFPGVVIFATNLAANFDPAFERRIRTHILFQMPDEHERERIWQVQLHAGKTPLADDVDFRALAAAYLVSGGDIKNAVLKAAQMAIAEPGPDAEKQIHQRHFETGIREVLAAKQVMDQSLFGNGSGAESMAALGAASGYASAWEDLAQQQDAMQGEMATLFERLEQIEGERGELAARVEAIGTAIERRNEEERNALDEFQASTIQALRHAEAEWQRGRKTLLYLVIATFVLAIGALTVALLAG